MVASEKNYETEGKIEVIIHACPSVCFSSEHMIAIFFFNYKDIYFKKKFK